MLDLRVLVLFSLAVVLILSDGTPDCPDGYVVHDNMCKLCTEAHEHAIGTSNHTQCVCDADYYDNPPSGRRKKRQFHWRGLYCTPCPQGYSTGGAIGAESEDECNECADGYVKHNDMCKTCEVSHVHAIGTPDHLQCVCDADYYNNPPPSSRRKRQGSWNWPTLYCTPCPQGYSTGGAIGVENVNDCNKCADGFAMSYDGECESGASVEHRSLPVILCALLTCLYEYMQ